MTPKPLFSFALCESCDPPRLMPARYFLAHLTEHHLSVEDIQSAEVVDADEADE